MVVSESHEPANDDEQPQGRLLPQSGLPSDIDGLRLEGRMFENGWYNVTYICAKCGAKDTDRRLLSDASPIAPAANCWKCGGGRGLDPGDMMANRKGMFPQPVTIPSLMPA